MDSLPLTRRQGVPELAEEPMTGTAAYNTELKRKEGLRGIRYYYKGHS